MKNSLFMAILLLSAAIACTRKESVMPTPTVPPVVQTPPPATPGQKLIEAASFQIGAATTVAQITNESQYDQTLKGEHNQLTAEYEMKMKQVWTADGQYNFGPVDALVNYAQQNKMAVHGHTLLWYQSFPDWFKAAKYDSVTFENKVKTFITAYVGRYKGKIRSWDVANEIFNDDGSLRVESQIQGTFRDPVGFVGRCFKYTRDADPGAKLFYNDYNVVLASGKRNAMKSMAARFKKEGIPIDGLGEQFHYGIRTSPTSIASGFADLASSGLLIHLSEIDSRVNVDRVDTYVFTDTDKAKQADFYRSIAKLYNGLPAGQKFAMTMWGVTDKYTWLRDRANGNPKEYPLLFDESFARKSAYTGFLEGLK